MSSFRPATAAASGTAATEMVPVPPLAFAATAVLQRLLARRKDRHHRKNGRGDRAAGAGRPAGGGQERPARCGGGRRVLATGVGLASAGLLVAGASELAGAETSIDARTPSAATTLVTSGVFARTRNPLYLGLTGLLVAHALWLGSRRALLAAGGFVLVIDRCQVPAEEAALAQRFGKAYRAYCEQVPRWLLR